MQSKYHPYHPPATDTGSSLGCGALASTQPVSIQQFRLSAEAPPPPAAVSLHQQPCHSTSPLGRRGFLASVQPGQHPSCSSGRASAPTAAAAVPLRRSSSSVSRPRLHRPQPLCLSTALAVPPLRRGSTSRSRVTPPPLHHQSLRRSSISVSRPRLQQQQQPCLSTALAVPPLGQGSTSSSSCVTPPLLQLRLSPPAATMSLRRSSISVARLRLCSLNKATPPAAAVPLHRSCSFAFRPRLYHQ